jgi:beta-glucanase (GH16 family)
MAILLRASARWRSLRIASVLLIFFVTAPLRAQSPGSLIFEDYFNARSLNTTYWDPFITDDSATGWPWNTENGQPSESSAISGPDNFNLDYDQPSFIHTGSGLTLTARAGTNATGYLWTGAVISSYPDDHFVSTQGFTFQDAFVEVWAKLPYTGNGSWPAIWFLAGPGGNGAEIDLHEGGFLDGSVDPDRVFACNLHSAGNVQYLIDSGSDLSAAYHTYAMAYKQGEYVRMYLDGKLMCSYTENIPTGPYYIVLNNAVASRQTYSWHSVVDSSTASSNEMRVAYVKVYGLM